MTEPVKSGDMAEVIEGALGKKSPNVGKIVRVEQFRGDHSKYGRIWRVSGDSLVTESGVKCAVFDCAQSWLRKIEPPVGTRSTTTGNCSTNNQIKKVESETIKSVGNPEVGVEQ